MSAADCDFGCLPGLYGVRCAVFAMDRGANLWKLLESVEHHVLPNSISPPRASGAAGEAMATGESVSPIVAHVQRLLRSRPRLAVTMFVVAMIVGAVQGISLHTPQYTSRGAIQIQPVEGATDQRSAQGYAGFMATQAALATSRPILHSALEDHLRGDARFADKVAGWNVDAMMDHLSTEQLRGTQLIRFNGQNRDPALAQAIVDAVMQSFITSMQREFAAADRHQLDQALRQHDQMFAQLDQARQQVARLRDQLTTARRDESLRQKLAEAAPDQTAGSAQPLTAVQIAQTDPRMRQYLDALAVDQMRLADLSNRFAPRHPAVRQLIGSIATQTQQIELYAERLNQARRAAASLPSVAITTTPNPPPPESTQSVARIEIDLAAANQHYLNLQNTIDATGRRIDQLRLQSSWKSAARIVEPANFPATPLPGSISHDLVIGALAGLAFALIGLIVYCMIDHRCHTIQQAVAESDNAYVLGDVPDVRSTADASSQRRAIQAVHQLRVRIESPRGSTGGSAILITAGQSGGGATELTIALGASLAAARARCLLIDLDAASHRLTAALGPNQKHDFETILRRDSSLTEQQIDQAVSHALESSQYVRQTLVDLGYRIHGSRPLTPQQVRTTCDEQLLRAVVELGLLSRSGALLLLQAGRDQSLGLWDVLRGEPLQRCTLGTTVPLLDLLPMTPPSAHTAAALELDAIDRMLQTARSCYDLVLIDASLTSASLTVAAMAPRVDSVIMSVPRHGSLRQVRCGLEQLGDLGAPPVGIVLNHGARRAAAAPHAENTIGPLASLLMTTHTAAHRTRKSHRRAA